MKTDVSDTLTLSEQARMAGLVWAFVRAGTLEERLDGWHEIICWLRWEDSRIPFLRYFLSRSADYGRLEGLVSYLEANEEMRRGFERAVAGILQESSVVNLIYRSGLPAGRGMLGEFFNRLGQKLVPRVRLDLDLETVLRCQYGGPYHAERIARMPLELFDRVARLFACPEQPEALLAVRQGFADAFRLLASRVHAHGLSSDLPVLHANIPKSPFFRIILASDRLVQAWMEGRPVKEDATEWRTVVSQCRREMAAIREKLEVVGVSVDTVFSLEIMEKALERMEKMVSIMAVPPGLERGERIQRLLASLVEAAQDDGSIRDLFRDNLHLLYRKIVERTGRIGEHYIALTRRDYWHTLLAAAGGGIVTVFTAAAKIRLSNMGLPPLVEGLSIGFVYALSFILLQVFGFVLATKQPAMTAATLAGFMRGRKREQMYEEIESFTARIVHTQIAAAVGNVAVVALGATVFESWWRRLAGSPFIGNETAEKIYRSLSPLDSGTVFYAILTGVILWAASIAGGWFDNWALRNRVAKGIADSPLRNLLGRHALHRASNYFSSNFAGWMNSISLGFMLGMVHPLGKFTGLPLDVRHVTLNTGILAVAVSSMTSQWYYHGWFLKAFAGVATMFVFNLGTSFILSLFTAARAYDMSDRETGTILLRIAKRFLRHPGEFLLPPRTDAKAIQ